MSTTLRENSIKLFKETIFQYYPIESGCAALFVSYPFGGTMPLGNRIAEIVGKPEPKTEEELKEMANIYADFYEDFPIIIKQISLATGRYTVPDCSKAGEKIFGSLKSEDEATMQAAEKKMISTVENNFADYMTDISVTDTHLAMLKLANWQLEYGFNVIARDAEDVRQNLLKAIPQIHEWLKQPEYQGRMLDYPIIAGDGKRPYGDYSYYYYDLEDAQVPGIKADEKNPDEEGRMLFSSKEQERINGIQAQLYLVLQAMTQYGTFEK